MNVLVGPSVGPSPRVSVKVSGPVGLIVETAPTRMFLAPDEAVRIMVLIFVSDCAHRAVVTHIIAALQERVPLLSCQIFVDVVSSIVVMRVCGVRDIRRAIRVIDSDQHLLFSRGYRGHDGIVRL